MTMKNDFEKWWEEESRYADNPYPDGSEMYWAYEGWLGGQRSKSVVTDALEAILSTKPFVGMNLNAKVNSPDAVEWNVHTIARQALSKARRDDYEQ